MLKVSMVFLAVVTTYFVFDTMQMVAPTWVSVASSLALSMVYVGLAYAKISPQQRTSAMIIAGSALAIEASMGVIHTLRILAPDIFTDMDGRFIGFLAFLFGVPFSALLFSIAHFVVHESEDLKETRLTAVVQNVTEIANATNTAMPSVVQHVATIAESINASLPGMLGQMQAMTTATNDMIRQSAAETAKATGDMLSIVEDLKTTPHATTSKHQCPNCGTTLTQGQYGQAIRRGYCTSCKPHSNGHTGEDAINDTVAML